MMRNSIRRTIVWGLAMALVLVGTMRMAVHAGYFPLPLEAELDLAERVVVGTIADTEVTDRHEDGRVLIGKATVTVEETLKGPPEKTAVITVVLKRDRGAGEGEQSPEAVRKIGDSGIWLIGADGRPAHLNGLLSRERIGEVKGHLEMLKERKWSKPVGGIAVWVGAMKRESAFGDRAPPIVFAVKNVSEKPVYLPLPRYQGVVCVVARDEKGREITPGGRGEQGKPDRMVYCQTLLPGMTAYMHPDTRDYGTFHFPKDTAPGTYTIQGTISNDRPNGMALGRDERRVQLWRGTVTSPAITVTIVEDE